MKTVLLHHPCKVDALASLHAAAFDEAWNAEWIGKLVAQPGTFAFVTENDSGGFILVRAAGREAEVLTLAVAAAARRRGIGSALIRAAAEHAHGLGAKTLFLEVGSANIPARTLYAGLGFAEIGRRAGYYTSAAGGREDALVLSVELPLSRVGKYLQLD